MVVKAIINAIGKSKVKPPEFPIGTKNLQNKKAKLY
jgi:hypothetical protein